MSFTFDHAIIAVHDLDQAMTDFRTVGFTVKFGGEHASGTTHNALICFADGSYLELLATTGKPPKPDNTAADYSHLVTGAEGYAGYALRSDNLAEDVAALRSRGLDVGAIREGRRLRADGVELRWRTAAIGSSMSPFFIEDITPRNLRVPDDLALIQHINGITGIGVLELQTSNLAAAGDYYRQLLDLTPVATPEGWEFQLGMTRLRLLPDDSATGETAQVWRLDVTGGVGNFASDETLVHGARFAVV